MVYRHDSEEYVASLSNFGWLVFIDGKQHILDNRTEFVDSVYMLTAALAHLLCYLPRNTKVGYFELTQRSLRKLTV